MVRSLKILCVLVCLAAYPIAVLAEENIAIRVGDRKVTMDQYLYNYKTYEDSYRARYGSKFDEKIRQEMKKKLVDDLTFSEICMGEADRRGISAKTYISEEEIEEYIMKNPLFYTEGNFDRNKYEAAKTGTGTNWSALRNEAEQFLCYEQKRMIMPSKVLRSLRDEVKVSESDILSEYYKNNELMKVRYVAVDPFKYANAMEITEDQLTSYYRAHAKDYMKPESAQYKVLYFNPKNYLDMVFVSEPMRKGYYEKNIGEFKAPSKARVKFVLIDYGDYADKIYGLGENPKEYYEANIDNYIEPAKVKVRYIFVQYDRNSGESIGAAEEKLRNVIHELSQGVSFVSLARKYSDDIATAQSGGDLGFVDKTKLQDPFKSILFSLNKGDISGVIQTEKGYHIMQVEDKREERVKFYPEVKDEIENELLRVQAKPLAYLDAKRFMLAARTEGFDEYAAKKNFTVYRTEYFGEDGKVPLIGKNQNFVDSVFRIATNEVSDIIEYDKGYAIFQIIDRTSLEYQPYESVNSLVEDKIGKQNSSIFAKNDAMHVRNRLIDGASLEAVLESNIRMTVYATDWVDNGIAEVKDRNFVCPRMPGMNNVGNVTDVIERPDGYYLVIMSAKLPPRLPDIALVSREVASRMAEEYGEKRASAEADGICESLKKGASIEGIAAERSLKVREIGPFGQREYVIDGKYMVDFVAGCFGHKKGDNAIVRNLSDHCVVEVLWRDIDREDFEKNRRSITDDILRTKKKEFSDKWLESKLRDTTITVSVD